jgi:hypothetical protein
MSKRCNITMEILFKRLRIQFTSRSNLDLRYFSKNAIYIKP